MQWKFQKKQTVRNILAILLPFFSLTIQFALWEFLNPYIWILFFPTVYISAWLGNKRSGFIAATISALLGLWFFAAPTFTLAKEFQQYIASIVFLISGFAFTIFHDRLRKLNERHLELIENTRSAEKRHIEEILALSEYKYSLIFDKSPIAIALAKFPESEMVAVNDAFLSLFEYKREEVIGKTTLELGLNTTDSLNEVRKRMNESGIIKNFKTVRQTKNGKEINMVLSMSWVDILGVKHSLATIQDITAQKQAAIALKESKDISRTILDTILDCVITINETGIIQSINPSTVATFGYAQEELIGNTITLLMPESHAAKHPNYLQRYFKTGGARIIGIGREVRAKRKDGTTFPIYLSVGEFVLNGERSFVGIIRDITTTVSAREELNLHRDNLEELVKNRTKELQAIQKDLLIAKEKAEQASASKTQFLASASHDLRQPLQAANMLVYLLGEKVIDVESTDIINKLKSSLDSLGELLNSLLDISKLDAGMIYPDKVGFPLSVIFKKIGNDMSVIADAKGLALRIFPTDAIVYSDPKLLEQIIRNLVFNAIKYTKTGRVLLGARTRGARLLIQVYDTGIGIPNDKLDKIFEEFYQVNNSARNRKKGLGLGLAIVRRLVKLMGHTIEVKSNLGRGTKFEITVPISEVAKRKNWFNTRKTNQNSSSKVIVVIEDDSQNLETLELLLGQWGHTVITGLSAEDALTNLYSSHARPDLILADYRLENEKTGIEAIALIRSRFNPFISALLLTGDTSPTRLREAKASGLKILHKPINPIELKTTIDSFQTTLKDSEG
jgi:PAS domain S-box-containing protein